MIFYEITLKSLPRILFAYPVQVEHYQNHFHKPTNFLELCLVEEGEIVYQYSDQSKTHIVPGTFDPVVQDMDCDTFAFCDMPQRHTTVGVTVEYDSIRHDTKNPVSISEIKEKLNQQNYFLIPFQEPLETDFSPILARLTHLCSTYSSPRQENKLKAISEWFLLVNDLTKYVLKRIEPNAALPPSAARYVREAEKYIAGHYQHTLSVSEIAAALGLSAGYLHTIFKNVNGISIVEFINQYRINLAKQYILNQNLPLNEIAAQVGISDPAYMSRLFKKITGISYRQFCKKKGTLKKGIDLSWT